MTSIIPILWSKLESQLKEKKEKKRMTFDYLHAQ